MLRAIREALNQELVLGREDFIDRIEQMTTRQTRPGRNGRPRMIGVGKLAGDYYVFSYKSENSDLTALWCCSN